MLQKYKIYKTTFLLLLLLFSLSVFGQGQITTTNLDTTKLSNNIKFKGKIKTAVRWTDKSGENVVITTETGETIGKTAPDRDAALYAYHYIMSNDSAILIWMVYDYIKDCPVDIEANFVKNTFQVTDLNKDGIAEIWLMYRTVCHGGISPSDMKIIMYQGKNKYAMRGKSKVKVSEKEFYGGDYKFDNSFADGPEVFKDFAKKLWDNNMMQTWGE